MDDHRSRSRDCARRTRADRRAWRQRARAAVATLHAYLDEQGSLQRAAQRLHVHRGNAVVYSLERLRAAGIDLDDPDNRFALQLACRARLTTTEA
ncbi:MAG: helix-turn-helix domain-containing protein [Marmoricola sp.]